MMRGGRALLGRWLAVAVLAVALTGPTMAPGAAAATEGFRDVTGSHQFYREISWLAARGITTGYPDNSFRPATTVSREAFAAYLYRLADRPAVRLPARSPFRDVSASALFYREIVWLSQQGITTGWADGTFRPKAAITRDAMAAFLYRFEGRPTFSPPARSPFTDVTRSTQFYTEITWMRASGRSTGWADGTYRPYATTSREATAAFLFRGYAPRGYTAPTYVPPRTWDPDRDVSRMLSDPESVLVVVNKRRPLDPLRYVPPDLVTVTGVPGGSSHRLRREAAQHLTAMSREAQRNGLSFSVGSSYRSYSYQAGLFRNYSNRFGVASAERFSARPGHSEHQTGLGVDLSSTGCSISGCFGSSAVGRWVARNAHDYGYIVRYPEGKTHVTGYIYEPWHLRYVGVELATEMRARGVTTLEEFFGLGSAPTY